jgi:hypothetical protein
VGLSSGGAVGMIIDKGNLFSGERVLRRFSVCTQRLSDWGGTLRRNLKLRLWYAMTTFDI